MNKRKSFCGGHWSPRHCLRCRLCLALLCRGEGVRRKGYGTLCIACALMTRRAEARQRLTQQMLDARDARSLAKSKCERDGACRLRRS